MAVNGVATFSGLSVDMAGSAYQLTASFPAIPSASSAFFDILCFSPAFVAADPAPDLPNVPASQTLTISNPAGSAVPTSFAFMWDTAFTIHSFGADPDGVPGLLAGDEASCVPLRAHRVLRGDQAERLHGLRGHQRERDLRAGHRLRRRTVRPDHHRHADGGLGAVESQDTGYRLILQDSLFVNPPETLVPYTVQASLGSQCSSPWMGNRTEMMGPAGAGCTPTTAVGSTLRITKSGSRMTIDWTAPGPPQDPCMTGYAVFASTDATAWSYFAPPSPGKTWT